MDVSVIVPCYNAERWIARTLDSILAQTAAGIGVVVVNDCSTDGTRAILGRYQVTIIDQSTNRGQAAAFNAGLAHSDSRYVAFCDSDDLWRPEHIKRAVEALEQHPDSVLAYSNGHAIDAEDRELWSLLPSGHQPPTPDELLLNCVITCPAQVVARRSAVGTFTEGLQSCDHDQWIRMRERGPFICIDEPLTSYRVHPAQISRRRKQWEDGFTILRNARARYPYRRSTVRKRLAVLHYRLGAHDLRNGHGLRGLWHWAAAGALDPVRAVKIAIG
jgi:glycosyltransferase involved in cell wall biosynthesis